MHPVSLSLAIGLYMSVGGVHAPGVPPPAPAPPAPPALAVLVVELCVLLALAPPLLALVEDWVAECPPAPFEPPPCPAGGAASDPPQPASAHALARDKDMNNEDAFGRACIRNCLQRG